MPEVPLWLHQVQLLKGPDEELVLSDALIGAEGKLLALGDQAISLARELRLAPTLASPWLLAPVLVDPHSVLDEPWEGAAETLSTLEAAAAAGGYGTVALLPWAHPWRDRPERLDLQWASPLTLLLWGSFSLDGADTELAGHADQIAAGAIGLAGGPDSPPWPLLERALVLAEAGEAPILLAPRQSSLTAGGFVRECVDCLRSGWPPDPVSSELLPLQGLITLAEGSGQASLILMNLSTAAGITALERAPHPPAATVCWWHLVADSASLSPTSEGWRMEPSLGSPRDREALIRALETGVVPAVAVHHQALDAEARLLPQDQRPPGVAGHGGRHGLVLPSLWKELVEGRGWSPSQLWQVLSWAPSRLLRQPPERLMAGSRRWLLFDPSAEMVMPEARGPSRAANQPLELASRGGGIRATGLVASDQWCFSDPPQGGVSPTV